MKKCMPTKKAWIFHMRQDKTTFTQIGTELGLSHTTISRTYHELEKQGENPDFYLKKDIPCHPQLLTPHVEQCAAQAITSGECMDATDVQCTLFPNISASTLHRMFLRKGMKGRICWKKTMALKNPCSAAISMGQTSVKPVNLFQEVCVAHR
jgi:hypothetical protein